MHQETSFTSQAGGVLAAGTQDQLRAGAAEGGAFPAVTLGHAPGHHEVAMAMAVPHGCPSPVGTLPAEVLACCPIAMGLAWSLPVPVLSHPSFPLLP